MLDIRLIKIHSNQIKSVEKWKDNYGDPWSKKIRDLGQIVKKQVAHIVE